MMRTHEHERAEAAPTALAEPHEARSPSSTALADAGAVLGGRMAGQPAADTAASVTGLANNLYAALAAGDHAALAHYYDPSVHFHDPLFGTIVGSRKLLEMWTLAGSGSTHVSIVPHVVSAQPLPTGGWQVQVHWDADYRLAGRHVVNHSDTTLQIVHGKIVSQVDSWSLDAWARQAVPLLGGHKWGDYIIAHASPAALTAFDAFNQIPRI